MRSTNSFCAEEGRSFFILFVHYRSLNAVMKREVYLIPRLNECIDSLDNAAVPSTLDTNSAYWQVKIENEDRHKATFTSHHVHYRSVRMQFGLRNGQSIFQQKIEVAPLAVKWQFILVYIDDIVGFGF